MLDRDISERIWNNYLKKYKDVYQLVRDEIGIWQIRCKYGTVQTYSIMKQQLVAVLDFNSPRHLSAFKNKLNKNRVSGLRTTQEGDQDVCIMFNEKDIKSLVNLFLIRKRKNYTPETREKIRQQMQNINKNKNISLNQIPFINNYLRPTCP